MSTHPSAVHVPRVDVAGRPFVFALEIVYLAILGALAGLEVSGVVHFPATVLTIPVAAAWFGALGGVLISLVGVSEHDDSGTADAAHPAHWNRSYRYWHWSRPFAGAAVAVVAILFFQSGVLAIGVPADKLTNGGQLFYYVLAFVVGYREETFRELLKKVTDVILSPGGAEKPTVVGIEPSAGPGGAVEILGTGFAEVTAVKVGDQEVPFAAESETKIAAQLPVREAPGRSLVFVIAKKGIAAGTFEYQ